MSTFDSGDEALAPRGDVLVDAPVQIDYNALLNYSPALVRQQKRRMP